MYFEIESCVIEKAAAGDIDSFEKIVKTYEKAIYNVCYRFFNNIEDAQDAAQEVFIKIYRNLRKYNYKCKFSTWAHKIAINSCIDALRKKKSQSALPLDGIDLPDSQTASPVDSVISKDMLKDVGKAISALNEDYRAAIILRDINGFSYQEISEITGVNPGTVKSRISRARLAVREVLLRGAKFAPISADAGKEAAK